MKQFFMGRLETKFQDEAAGEFEGYGAIFGNTDSHGDVIAPGAFKASLAEHKSRGTMPTMYAEHGPAYFGGDPLPVGVWTEMAEDENGLRVKGRISALDTDFGRRIRGLIKDGALRGLSIGYSVAPEGAVYGQKPGEPRRTLKAVNLFEVSPVTLASNHMAKVEAIKSALAAGEVPTLREVEEALREQFCLSRSQAAAFAAGGYKSLIARESGNGEAKPREAKAALGELRAALTGFSLTI